MLGGVLAHLGFHQKYGRPITVFMVITAWLPDIDCAALLLGNHAFSEFHRGPTHSIGGVVALSLFAALAGPLMLTLARRLGRDARPESQRRQLLDTLGFEGESQSVLDNIPVLFAAGLLVMGVHLVADYFFRWPIPVLWPITAREYALPVLKWGDKVVVLVLIGGVTGLALMHAHRRVVAIGTLAVLVGYVAGRYLFLGTL